MSKLGSLALGAAALLLIGQGCPIQPASPAGDKPAVVEEKSGEEMMKEGEAMKKEGEEMMKKGEEMMDKGEAMMDKKTSALMEDGTRVMMKGGVMMTEKDGQTAAMTETMMTADGSKALTSGEVMMKDGASVMMKEGESMMAKDGTMVKMMEKINGQSDAVTVTKSFTVTAKQWSFDPATITVKKGDRVQLAIKSIDVAHGFALSAFNVNQNLEPGQEVTVEFVADKTGSFPFVCSVFCGSGHGGMRGTLIVE